MKKNTGWAIVIIIALALIHGFIYAFLDTNAAPRFEAFGTGICEGMLYAPRLFTGSSVFPEAIPFKYARFFNWGFLTGISIWPLLVSIILASIWPKKE
jgi:hypothetical protein